MYHNSNNKHLAINYNILQWNVRSLTARLPSLQNLLSVYKCSFIILSETWLLPSRPLHIPNFKIFRSDRPDGYGGVAIATHNSFKTKLIPIDDFTRNRLTNYKIDLIGVEVVLTDASSPLKIWSGYIPNNINVPFLIWQSLFNLVTHNSLLCGDFNAFHPAWGSNSFSRRGNHIYIT